MFIDDARLFTSPPQSPLRPEQWSDISSILKAINMKRSDIYTVIIEDVIITVPVFAKEIVVNYCQNINARLWNEYSKQNKKSKVEKKVNLITNKLFSILKNSVGKMQDFLNKNK